MNILIAAVGEKYCPAARALHTEGVICTVVAMYDELDYARALAEIWEMGEEFCLLEHDVVPWAGAMANIKGCDQPWCVYDYPFHPDRIGHALGCLRVSEILVRGFPDLPKRWIDTPWRDLESAVYRSLITVSGERKPHLHGPPLSHLRV